MSALFNEVAAGAARYKVEIDMSSDSTHAKVVRLVGTGKRVLELGCASGHMSHVLRERNCQMVAVEIDPQAAETASAYCEHVIVGDLDRIDLSAELGADRFDVIVAADVLEHLKDPLSVLKTARRHLRPNGYVVASVPNIAHLSVRLALLGGRFPYSETGLLDHSHLRFYTRETVERLFEDAGFAIGHLERIERTPERSEVPYDRAIIPASLLESLLQDPESRTYQILVVAYPLPIEGLPFVQSRMRQLSEDTEAAKRESAQLHAQIEDLGAEKQTSQREASELRLQVQKLAAECEAARREADELRLQAQELAAKNEATLREADELSLQAQELDAENKTSQREAAQLRLQVQVLQEAAELSRQETAELRQIMAQQKEQLSALTTRVELLSSREKDLREMLLDAHDQLLRRDEEITLTVAKILRQNMREALPVAGAEVQQVPGKYLSYQQMLHEIRGVVRETLPPNATVIVVSKGDDQLLNLEGRQAWHFPQREDGIYAGYYPADSGEAIAQVEALRTKGAGFLLFPSTSSWWLEHYAEFRKHLEHHYSVVCDKEDTCLIFALCQQEKGDVKEADDGYRQLVQRVQDAVCAAVPAGANVIVASKGDPELVKFGARQGCHFPQSADGSYAGFYPSDSAAAIRHLEILREGGGRFLVFPQTAFWWLDHYKDLRRHLDRYYRRPRNDQDCIIYELSGQDLSFLHRVGGILSRLIRFG